jgi:hypothetical protein
MVLITDALSYSAADIFAAQFNDHGLGQIIGTEPQTGGGGGNVWGYEMLRRYDPLLAESVRGATFDIAVRRTRRVARGDGVILEDRGVLTTPPVDLTARDVLGDNDDLITAAMGRFDDPRMRPRRLRCTASRDYQRFRVRGTGLDRVDVYIDGRPTASLVRETDALIDVRGGNGEPREASFQGFLVGAAAPVATVHWRRPTRPASPAPNGAGDT